MSCPSSFLGLVVLSIGEAQARVLPRVDVISERFAWKWRGRP